MNITLNWPDGREITYNCWDSDGEHLAVGIINSLVEGASIYPISRKAADDENEDSSLIDLLDREYEKGGEAMRQKALNLIKDDRWYSSTFSKANIYKSIESL